MILIEPMSEFHLNDVRGLAKQLGYEVTAPNFQSRFAAVSKHVDHEMFVAIENNRTIGWIHLCLIYALIEDLRTEIKAFVIDEKFREQGVGKMMLDYTKEWSKQKNAKKIFLRTNIIRDDAHRFYERENFVRKKTSHIYELVL